MLWRTNCQLTVNETSAHHVNERIINKHKSLRAVQTNRQLVGQVGDAADGGRELRPGMGLRTGDWWRSVAIYAD